MSKQLGFYIETDRCIKCWACQVACKAWKGTKAGTVTLRRVMDIWTGTFPDVTRTFVSMSCMHCENPPCAEVCPVGAITKRAEDGIVVVDQEKCIGCRACFTACPFGVPQYDENKMVKCDFCIDRLEDGKEPACVATCPTQALHCGTMDELSEMASKKAAQRLAAATESNPSVLVSK